MTFFVKAIESGSAISDLPRATVDPMSARIALLSVADKTGLVPFAQRLANKGWKILSTGGTLSALQSAGIPAEQVSDHTGSPEVFGGRVKTLHPKIHGGILQRRDLPEHAQEAATQGIPTIDLVVVNLYPFRETIARPDCTTEDAIENIDIGGPCMIRAAAKNHASVTICCDPADYDAIAEAFEAGDTSLEQRRALALKAFRHTAAYDAAISTWLATQAGEDALLPAERHETSTVVQTLRYGENPHQAAALYKPALSEDFAGAKVLQGKALSYNNVIDLDAAVDAVQEFDEPACVIIKHTNPCGVGRDAQSSLLAYESALNADPISAFGGIIALNRALDGDVAKAMSERFFEVIAAPGFSAEALEILSAKKNLRLVDLSDFEPIRLRRRSTLFGELVQTADGRISELNEDWNVVTERSPSDSEATALRFLWRVCKHVKSNAIVVGNHERTFGVGAGQMSRVDSVELAIKKATADLQGAALASDAFFPFRDGLDAAAKAGIRAVIQPGGSVRDEEVIAAANEYGIAMVFTGNRHFRH